MIWVSSCSPLRYLCLCGWVFCTFSSPWHQGLFWVIISSPSLTNCTAPVTHSSWTCTLEFAVLNNWSKLYVFYIQLEEEINPLSSVYQAVFVRKTFSMLELFTALQAEIMKRLQSSCQLVQLHDSLQAANILVFLFLGVLGLFGYLVAKVHLLFVKKGKWKALFSVLWPCCHPSFTTLKSPVRMCAGHCCLLLHQSHPQLSIHVIPLTFAYSFFCCFCFTCALFHSCCIHLSLKIWITKISMPQYVLRIFVQRRRTLIQGQEICSFQLCDLLYTGRTLWAKWN